MEKIKKNRLTILLFAALAALVLSCATAPPPPSEFFFSPAEWQGSTLVGTRYGLIEGVKDRDKTLAWLGIPYAAPPVGELRWKAPQKPEPWQGLRRADRFGQRSAQRSLFTGMITGSEDSLYLNIWRPSSQEKSLPVYVWVHGGSNTSGAANESKGYYGHSLASKANLVFVSINYRLDVFGWFSHPALKTRNDPESDSGNFGTLDIIAALDWVRENIESFGGDPENVTVAGESAGALNVLSLLIAPKAKGLFHRAVIESGYTHGPAVSPEAFAVNLGIRLALRQNKAPSIEEASRLLAAQGSQELATWLRSASPRELLQLSKPAGKEILSLPCPIFDGFVLPSDGFAALADPRRRANVPIIIGTNREETKLFLQLAMNPRNPHYSRLVELSSLLWKAEGADSVADAYGKDSAAGDAPPGKVYLYRFDWGAQDEEEEGVMGGIASRRLGASHAIEIPFFLQTDGLFGSGFPLRIYTRANKNGRQALQSAIGEYLADFARTGDPNHSLDSSLVGRIYWEPWDPKSEKPSYLVLDAGFKNLLLRLEQGRVRREDIILEIADNSPPSLKSQFVRLAPLFF
ncbi:MAG: carboxylesterase family protein [Spirochaetia bacterium]|nr:carboxylesterase family protein [Spirochaetia bacterium]